MSVTDDAALRMPLAGKVIATRNAGVEGWGRTRHGRLETLVAALPRERAFIPQPHQRRITMARLLAVLALAASLLIAACGGSGSSAGTSIEPVTPDSSPSLETSPDTMSPEASPS